ncbi:MAG: hypothetical protein A3G08_00855 [Candidatus Magasanikbacteria bacterium RIFCSPLOWO2_12_FULL_47_9b]|nr:MAG: hypothetical protein A3I74_02075 [Candidatus Magasanikbacteria bacterium RIFCSPLOWO2_02_FULL_47_16]OGH79698.1 MAG: hypothetical protein A3C10_01330 [Candidatus Magasanikbacteria bacterium RIFCSPHIGHO2_02_FULL_48_18]OGH82866.1 MAG: hypothetical protein A3G08_00855 [Candidatus Magasanikbacteria bacterium RIFCSPLOWO2_12_FULL_47_9b]
MARQKKYTQTRHDPDISRGIIAVLLGIAAVIMILSFFDKAGTIGIVLDEWVLSFLFGSIRFAAPAVILVMVWFIVQEKTYEYHKTHAVGAGIFFLALASLFHLGFDPQTMWREALEGHGGGIFGMGAWPLKSYLGAIASIVILIGLTLVSVLLMFNISFPQLAAFFKNLFPHIHRAGTTMAHAGKKLFAPSQSSNVTVGGDYEEDSELETDDAYEEDTEDIREPKRQFFTKHIEPDEEEIEADETETPGAEEGAVYRDRQHPPAPPQETDWTQHVIVKSPPSLSLLSSKRGKPTSGDIQANAEIIKDTLAQFHIDVDMGEVRVGPTVTQYSLKPAKGVKLSRITTLSNDLALALAAHPIRIEAPIPGKSLVGIEVPNQKAAMVSLKELLEAKEFQNRPHNLMIALGKDVAGKVWFADLPKMPHLLIAGATGSGKTVCVNTIIMSLLYQNTAETLRMIMVDPKRVELTLYNGIPHLLTPVITNTQKTINALKWTIGEMDRRFEVLSQNGSRDIHSYNRKFPKQKLPHIIFIIDELADLMATAANEVEAGIIRLAQMARAVGIYLILATQRPSVDVITGLMKANIPTRIAFSVASLIDSRTILDTPGAEKLIGRGDMLFATAELSKPVRIQGAFISEEEVGRIVEYLRGDEEPIYIDSIVGKQGGTVNMFGGPTDDQDPLFEEAKKAILQAGKASASFLQRRLKIGYARAARILDELEDAGIIGPGEGAKPREILVTETDIDDGMMEEAGQYNVYTRPSLHPRTQKENTTPPLGEADEESVYAEEDGADEEGMQDEEESQEEKDDDTEPEDGRGDTRSFT